MRSSTFSAREARGMSQPSDDADNGAVLFASASLLLGTARVPREGILE